MSEIERLRLQNEMMRNALASFGCYPDAWDNMHEKTRLELRIEKPANRWAQANVVWRLGELQRAAKVLREVNRMDQEAPAGLDAISGKGG